MNTTDKLKLIISKCKASVTILFNDHKDCYMTAAQEIKEKMENAESDINEVTKEVLNRMIETDCIINIHFYPETPIGSYSVYHYDLDMALDKCIDILNSIED